MKTQAKSIAVALPGGSITSYPDAETYVASDNCLEIVVKFRPHEWAAVGYFDASGNFVPEVAAEGEGWAVVKRAK